MSNITLHRIKRVYARCSDRADCRWVSIWVVDEHDREFEITLFTDRTAPVLHQEIFSAINALAKEPVDV